LVGRYIEFVTGGVFDEQVVARGPGDITVDKAFEAPNAVVMMDNVVPGVQVAIRLVVALSPPPPHGAVRASATGDFAFANNRDAERGKDETAVNAARENRRLDGVENVHHGEAGTGLCKKTGDALGGARTVHRDNHVDSAARPAGDRNRNRFGVSGGGTESPHFIALIPRRRGDRRRFENIGVVTRLEWQIERRMRP
jgi:hypothetical protein